MKILLKEDMLAALKHRLMTSEDAEALNDQEYTVDLYDEEPPVCFELALLEDGVDVLAAAALKYDDALDGYYLGEQRFDMENLKEILIHWAREGGGAND